MYVCYNFSIHFFFKRKKCEQPINYRFVFIKTIMVDSRPFSMKLELKQDFIK